MKIIRKVGLTQIAIVCRTHTKERLKTTCFRNNGTIRLAGNFFQWFSVEEFLQDPCILHILFEEFFDVYLNGEFGSASFEFEYKKHVGWTSTDDISKYKPEDLEPFNPNRKSTALRVKTNLTHIKAPTTNLITVVFELKDENGFPVFIVHSMYPGKDIGPLFEDVTAREGQVFFGWDHPGE